MERSHKYKNTGKKCNDLHTTQPHYKAKNYNAILVIMLPIMAFNETKLQKCSFG